MKLLKPKTRIHTPVNCTASANEHSKALINAGNMGARASGPSPCVNVTMAADVMHAIFHGVLQFKGSCGSADG